MQQNQELFSKLRQSQLLLFCIERFIFFCWAILTEGTMVMLKISAFLVAYALVICQMYCSHAAPARPGLESMSDRVTLTDYEARRLLNAIVKEFVQMTAEELEQQATEGNSSVTAQKRACNTATCVTHRLADFLSRSGGMGNSNFVPTNVGAKAFGRRRRSLQM